jgi:transposase
LRWLWAFATPSTVVYRIAPGRGFPEAEAVLGVDYAGVLVRDGWAPYRQFTHAQHQTCVAHLLRRAKDLATDHPRATWPRQIQAVLQDALALRDRHTAGTVSDHGVAVARGHLFTRLAVCLDAAIRHADLQRFAAHLAVELPAMFSFLFDPTADATNWRAEQAIRPAVVNRKVSGGNRSPRGADAQQILASLVHTARLRHLDAREILVDLLRAPTPAASAVLASPN